MRFNLIDRIVDLQPGESLTGVKNLTMAEEYLRDHFPNFPVMPGVLMLEAMTQAAAWLVRVTEDFAHSIVVLKQANNVKYGQFVEPGQTLTVSVDLLKMGENEAKIKARGMLDGRVTVNGRLVLAKYNLGDRNPIHKHTDELIKRDLRRALTLIYPEPLPVAPKSPV